MFHQQSATQDIVSEEVGDKSKNSKGNDAKTLDSIKPEATVVPPVADGYIVSYLSTTPYYTIF